MWVAAMEMSRVVVLRWLEVSAAGGGLWVLWCRMQMRIAEGRRERREQEELQAYARLDVRLMTEGGVGELARRVSRLMAEKSAFPRTAMLVRDADGRLAVAGSAGMDEATVRLLNTWAEGVEEDGRKGRIGGRRAADGLGRRVGMNGIAVFLGKGREEVEIRWAVVIPLWATGGRMMGALAVGADGLLNVRQRELDDALEPIEALAVKVARAMENAAVADRLLRAERLAGLGLLAGGAAHALSNPLTAVLGFAELIVGSTGEARVKEDAEIIVREALRMREIVETLLEFSRLAGEGDGLVDVMELVRTVAVACLEKLETRGVRLEVLAEGEMPGVWGNRVRLRQLLEHLLNNAAEALGGMDAVAERVIRIAVSSGEGERVHLIVSDTGPGFREPGRVFDPFFTGRKAGMGLSVCYGIVQEHGGEISAFNLHPHGAAVAVELPIAPEKISNVVEEAVFGVNV